MTPRSEACLLYSLEFSSEFHEIFVGLTRIVLVIRIQRGVGGGGWGFEPENLPLRRVWLLTGTTHFLLSLFKLWCFL